MAYKEIVTKAVIGKGKKKYHNKYQITTEQVPTTILGCWIINHNFSAKESAGKILINGSFDVNIWYSYDSDSKTNVISEKLDYNDIFNVKVRENADLSGDTEIIVRSLKQPTVQDVKIVNNQVELNIEKELGVEIVGESKVKIAVEEDEMPWDDLYDDQAIDNVDEEYIKNN